MICLRFKKPVLYILLHNFLYHIIYFLDGTHANLYSVYDYVLHIEFSNNVSSSWLCLVGNR